MARNAVKLLLSQNSYCRYSGSLCTQMSNQTTGTSSSAPQQEDNAPHTVKQMEQGIPCCNVLMLHLLLMSWPQPCLCYQLGCLPSYHFLLQQLSFAFPLGNTRDPQPLLLLAKLSSEPHFSGLYNCHRELSSDPLRNSTTATPEQGKVIFHATKLSLPTRHHCMYTLAATFSFPITKYVSHAREQVWLMLLSMPCFSL